MNIILFTHFLIVGGLSRKRRQTADLAGTAALRGQTIELHLLADDRIVLRVIIP